MYWAEARSVASQVFPGRGKQVEGVRSFDPASSGYFPLLPDTPMQPKINHAMCRRWRRRAHNGVGRGRRRWRAKRDRLRQSPE